MKKAAAILFAIIIFCTTVYAAEIYKTEEVIPIADGITLTKVKGFYSDHNISYSVIEADFTNENVGLSLLTPYTGNDTLDTVGNIAVSYPDAVAAVNADFFSTVKSGKALSLGIEIQDGSLLQSPINPDTMATFYEKDGVADISYLGFNVMVVAPNWQYAPIAHINKHTSYYGSILMYTPDFNGGYSPAPGGEVLEVVVEDGVITEFRRGMPSVKIPENGYVLVVSEGSTMFFANNFAVGDPVKLDYYVTPDILSSDTAFGGGALLVSEGEALTSFSHVISGYNPRSAIGIDKSGTRVYLVAVNGRTSESRGMTMSELAVLMKELGCYKALNLDGGGSTNMVASTVWKEKVHTVNTPSENRRVVNAVGLTYTSEPGEPYGILLEADSDVVFIGQSAGISYAVYDENLRPLSSEATLSSDKGTFDGTDFIGTEGGEAHIFAACGEAEGAVSIYVIDKIAGINGQSLFTMNGGECAEMEISVFDEYGHESGISDFSAFSFATSDPSVAYASDGTIYAVGNGSCVITVSKDGASFNAAVTVGSTSYDYRDDFEALAGEFSSYPAYVGGDYSLSEEFSRSKSTSGRLYYDFTAETEDTKAAYLTLSQAVTLSDDEDEISVYAKTDSSFAHSLKALCTDKNSKALYLNFEKASDEDDGFSLYRARISSAAARPVTLTRLYVAALPDEAADEGFVYFDDLSFRAQESPALPYVPSSVYCDPLERDGAGRTFAVGSAAKSETLISKLAYEKATAALDKASCFALLGVDASDALNRRNEFYCAEDDDALYMSVNAGSSGIRSASSSQWDSIINALNSTEKQNIFIFSESSIFSSDAFENEAVRHVLASYAAAGKSVFVIQRGSESSLSVKDGVRYFTLADMSSAASISTRVNGYYYLEFSFGNSVTYRWRPVFN